MEKKMGLGSKEHSPPYTMNLMNLTLNSKTMRLGDSEGPSASPISDASSSMYVYLWSFKVVTPAIRTQGGGCFTHSPLPHVSWLLSWAYPKATFRQSSRNLNLSASHHHQGCEGSTGVPEMMPKTVWKRTQMCRTIFQWPIPMPIWSRKLTQFRQFFKRSIIGWMWLPQPPPPSAVYSVGISFSLPFFPIMRMPLSLLLLLPQPLSPSCVKPSQVHLKNIFR